MLCYVKVFRDECELSAIHEQPSLCLALYCMAAQNALYRLRDMVYNKNIVVLRMFPKIP